MNKTKLFFLIALFFLVIVYALSLTSTLFPSDVLNNIPSYSEDGWQRPKNSLLADPVYQFEPWRKFARAEIRAGNFPLWNDLNGAGVPFFANYQAAVLFPLNFIYYIFPSSFALLLISISKLLILFLGVYLYLKEIKIKKEIAIIGSFSISFAAFPNIWLLWPHTNVYIFLPWLLFVTEKIYKFSKNSYRWYMLLSFLYLSSLLGGHPETLLHILLIHTSYFIFKFRRNIKQYVYFLFSVLVGFLLGAIQIFPFIEYLQNSYVIDRRTDQMSYFFLPIKNFILNFIPFVFGAPHYLLYKPLDSITNFQEASGGYTGLVIIIIAVYWIFKSKNTLVKFWGGVVLASWLLSYKIWPFYLFNQLPLIRLSANHRLIAFSGFGLAVIFTIFLEEYKSKELLSNLKNIINKIWLYSIIILTLIFILLFFLTINDWRLEWYINSIRLPLYLILISTILFFRIVFLKKSTLKLFLILIIVILQSLYLFLNYNPLTQKKDFYPTTHLTKILRVLTPGVYLEVGNPSLPANLNLYYGLSNIQSYDAIDIKSFKKEFDKNFPNRNNWGNPESVSLKSLQNLNISYVISDFDINLKKQVIQKDDNYLLGEITKSKVVLESFIASDSTLKQIRIKPATYNRNNTCTLNVKISNAQNIPLINKPLKCENFRNNMFYVIPISGLRLTKGSKYNITFSSNTHNNKAISLYGDIKNKPFLEIFYKSNKKNNQLKLIGETKYYNVFKVPLNNRFQASAKSLVYKNSTKQVFDIKNNIQKNITIPINYYPGWVAKVNGNKVLISKSDSFMSVPLIKGNNLVELEYVPQSFLIGLFISLATFTIVLLISVRFVYQLYYSYVSEKIELFKKFIKSVHFLNAVIGIGTGLVIGVFLSSILLTNINTDSKNPFTTAINWITINNYIKSRDYFNYYAFSFIVFFGIVLGFIGSILWKRKK